MVGNPVCSERPTSNLINRFVERTALGKGITSHEAIIRHVDAIRRRRTRQLTSQDSIEFLMRERNIRSVEIVSELDADGMILPLGKCYADGFRMVIRKCSSGERMRFTIAHEICHTFFYEVVPEIKFGPHATDDEEERLCNFGAGALLVPTAILRRKAANMPICIESLQALAKCFTVSLASMLLRLKSLGVWDCQLSLWHRKLDGGFVLDRLYGGERVRWEWDDENVLKEAWNKCDSIFGRTFLSFQRESSRRRYYPVSYQLRRYATGLIALWGRGITPIAKQTTLPLFDAVSLANSLGIEA